MNRHYEATTSPPPLRLFAGGTQQPPSNEADELTVGEFYRKYFLPLWLKAKNASPLTIDSYRESVDHWEEQTANPVLSAIDEFTGDAFVLRLRQLPGKKVGSTLADRTIAKHCKNLNTIFGFAGPKQHNKRGRRNRNLLDFPPYLLEPDCAKDPPAGDFSKKDIEALLREAAKIMYPPTVIEGVTPADWWRAVIVFAACTGVRRGDILAVRYQMIHRGEAGAELIIPGAVRKKKKGIRQPLHADALAWVDHIRGGRGEESLIFPYLHGPRKLDDDFKALILAAGIKWVDNNRWMRFRKFHLTAVASQAGGLTAGLKAAQQSAGHSSPSVAQNHYVAGDTQAALKRREIDALPSIGAKPGDDRQGRLF